MKKVYQILVCFGFAALVAACTRDTSTPTPTVNCGTYNGNQLHIGPQGGCYYLNGGSSEKTYVDRSLCKC